MNEFLKLLMPQLLEYFKNETKVLEFIPKTLFKYVSENERKKPKNETTNE